ncbi:carbohydrate deacetylase [Dioszegia hungarica]|uniref:Carbohydrate deacetylase n=1 Tax=Dioszegia hungarica TaxID=4972 RepID=A0AA38LTE4_9TREE|nr:carbohydrate deacetylase [Dioszegia hungarica]KAI9634618.1 carbohydrate deacetylase [Dioszegia hungarica]
MLALTALALVPLLAFAAPTERQNGLTVVNNCYNSGQVALTFDDGPNNREGDIANALNSVGAKGTFFFNGNNYGCIYDHAQTLRDLNAQGHTLGSHTWSHPDLTKLEEWQIHQELEKVETAFIKILGLKPRYFRPPYGSYNDRVLNVLAQRGYKKAFIWSDVTGDALGDSLDKQKSVLNDVANQYPAPKMVLSHSVIDSAVDATWYGVSRLRDAGYQMVAVDTCLGNSGEWPYEYVGQPEQPNDSWRC